MRIVLGSVAWVLFGLALPTLAETPAAPSASAVEIDISRLAVFQPLPPIATPSAYEWTEPLADLGRMLYYDARLSKNRQISCNSCHALDNFGVDARPVSPGHRGQLGNRNSPTVYNAALQFAQFWDGRSPNVEEQAKGPVLNPIEMALPDEAHAVKVLKSIPGYEAMFKTAFPGQTDPITYDHMAKAIGAFERRLLTPSRWDRYLTGDKAALTDAEKRGLKIFLDKNCTICHSGALLGGQMFQKIGLAKPFPTRDMGRYDLTKSEADKFLFKVPSLRNILKTGPYFHDGSVATVQQAIRLMAEHQLAMPMDDTEVAGIVAFFGALTGEMPPESYIRKPGLPLDGPDTPAADPN